MSGSTALSFRSNLWPILKTAPVHHPSKAPDAIQRTKPEMKRSRYAEITPYITRDGSEIRELMHPQQQGSRHQSLAMARVLPGGATALHRHHLSEEIYHVSQGIGMMTLNDEAFAIRSGDTLLIPPGQAHAVRNTGTQDLLILCCCSPAYRHEDTELL
jgi:mannose-6-phosphate isomerase-like protein (cupin superfamily)